MKWTGPTQTGSRKAVFCLVAFLHLSCYQRMVNAVPCTDQNLTITADNKLVLYFNGVLILLRNASPANKADTVPLSASVFVIAVHAQNNGKNDGILGSTDNSIVTDESWKCSDKFYEGWQEVNFNDSAWLAAYVIGPHGIKPWQLIKGIRPDAFWIWVSPGSSSKDVYCRRTIDCDGPTTTQTPTTTQEPTDPPTPPPDPVPQSCRGASGETGQSCITSCGDRANGDYQSCKGCQVYAACHNEILHDNRPCAFGRYWDDKVKRCEEKSATCQECK